MRGRRLLMVVRDRIDGVDMSGGAVVLVVDDEPLISLALADHLADGGFQVIEAAHADAAIVILETVSVIDLVITDVMMPGPLDGFALRHWIEVHRPDIPVLTASGLTAMPQTSERPDVTKPYNYAQAAHPRPAGGARPKVAGPVCLCSRRAVPLGEYVRLAGTEPERGC